MIAVAEIGEYVIYDGDRCEVLDLGYRSPVGPTMEKGSVVYLLANKDNPLSDNVWVSIYHAEPLQPSVHVGPSTQGLGHSMTHWLDGLEARPDNNKLPEVITYLLAIQWDKEGSYGSSWCGKGEYRGIMSNIDRKYDRLDKIVNDEISGKRPQLPTTVNLTTEEMRLIGESKIDAVADLANYCLLYLTWLRKTNPGAFRLWVDKNVPLYLHEKIPFIQKYYQQYNETSI